MKEGKLKPILIEYSSPRHKEGVRKYFSGNYKVDYNDYVSTSLPKSKRSLGYNHQRNHSYVQSSQSLRELQ